MKLRFRIAMLCALLALVWAGALPQTSAGAVHPSDLARLLEPPPGEEESAMTGAFGAYVTLTDPSTGVAVMDTVLPRGWTAQLQTNWNFISTVNPCVATASFTSPDGQAQAVIQTAQDYLESPDNTGLIPYRDGADMTTYITRLAYKNASQFLDMYFSGILGTEGVVIQETPVDASVQSTLQQVAEAYLDSQVSALQALAGPYGYTVWPGPSEGTAAVRRYRFTASDGNRYVADALCLCIGIEYTTNNGYLLNTARPWTIPVTMFYIAPDEETLEKHQAQASMILDNCSQRSEFLHLKQAYGRHIRSLVMNRQANQIARMTQAQAQTYLNDYDASAYTSEAWADDWRDFIYDQQQYATLEGGAIKVSTAFDAVYQNGDEFYFGPVGGAPEGWTRLTPD